MLWPFRPPFESNTLLIIDSIIFRPTSSSKTPEPSLGVSSSAQRSSLRSSSCLEYGSAQRAHGTISPLRRKTQHGSSCADIFQLAHETRQDRQRLPIDGEAAIPSHHWGKRLLLLLHPLPGRAQTVAKLNLLHTYVGHFCHPSHQACQLRRIDRHARSANVRYQYHLILQFHYLRECRIHSGTSVVRLAGLRRDPGRVDDSNLVHH